MKEEVLVNYTATKRQADFFATHNKLAVFATYRGGGKTHALLAKMLNYLSAHDATLGVFVSGAFEHGYSDYHQGIVAELLGDIEFSKLHGKFLLKNSSQLLLRTGELPENLKGLKINILGFDEAEIEVVEAVISALELDRIKQLAFTFNVPDYLRYTTLFEKFGLPGKEFVKAFYEGEFVKSSG